MAHEADEPTQADLTELIALAYSQEAEPPALTEHTPEPVSRGHRGLAYIAAAISTTAFLTAAVLLWADRQKTPESTSAPTMATTVTHTVVTAPTTSGSREPVAGKATDAPRTIAESQAPASVVGPAIGKPCDDYMKIARDTNIGLTVLCAPGNTRGTDLH